MKLFAFISIVLFGGLNLAAAQATSKSKVAGAPPDAQAVRSSAAFSELILRRAEVEAELESLLLDFTEEYPKVKADRYSIAQLQKQIAVLLAVKPAEASKLTLALGKLMVKKVELDTDLWSLLQSLADGHPDVKRARRKVEIFDKAIKDILG
jgi:hypothetical protein